MKRAAVLLCCLLCAACQSPPSWEELDFPAPMPPEEAWFLARESAAACRLAPDELLSAEDRGEFVSLWETHLMAFNRGWRRRLHLRFLEEGGSLVKGFRFYVERQKNKAMDRPYSPEPSDWGADGQDQGLEGRFAQHLKIRLRAEDWRRPEAERPKREDPFGR